MPNLHVTDRQVMLYMTRSQQHDQESAAAMAGFSTRKASSAPNLASTLNQGAFNLGNAAGALSGDLALTHGMSYGNIPWIGAGFAAVGLGFTVVSYLLDRRPAVGRAGGRMLQTGGTYS
jgi:hypothetical protein